MKEKIQLCDCQISANFSPSNIKGAGSRSDAVVHERVTNRNVLTRDQLYCLLCHNSSHERSHRVQFCTVVPV